jgi:hypothetical protein
MNLKICWMPLDICGILWKGVIARPPPECSNFWQLSTSGKALNALWLYCLKSVERKTSHGTVAAYMGKTWARQAGLPAVQQSHKASFEGGQRMECRHAGTYAWTGDGNRLVYWGIHHTFKYKAEGVERRQDVGRPLGPKGVSTKWTMWINDDQTWSHVVK